MKNLRLIFGLTLVWLLSSCTNTDEILRDGIYNFQIQNYHTAFILLKPQALQGQPDAEYALGYMYYYGRGVPPDSHKARYWIAKAAKDGQSDAIAALKLM
jgi:TPR repeat protein